MGFNSFFVCVCDRRSVCVLILYYYNGQRCGAFAGGLAGFSSLGCTGANISIIIFLISPLSVRIVLRSWRNIEGEGKKKIMKKTL